MTGRIESRLVELGFKLPPVAAPVAAYVPAVLDGDRVWTSGQLPFVDGALPVAGRVGSGGDGRRSRDARRRNGGKAVRDGGSTSGGRKDVAEMVGVDDRDVAGHVEV